LVSVVALAACSSDPLADYFDQVGDVTSTMRSASIAALPDPSAPDRDGVSGVIAARQAAIAALETIDAPAEVRPEHSALILALTDLVAAGEQFLATTIGLDPADFLSAARGATEIDDTALRVATACDAVLRRGIEFGYSLDVRC
jgi:hypothetical protein